MIEHISSNKRRKAMQKQVDHLARKNRGPWDSENRRNAEVRRKLAEQLRRITGK